MSREVWGIGSASSGTDYYPYRVAVLSRSPAPQGPTTPRPIPLSRRGSARRTWSPQDCPWRSLCPRRETATATSQAEHNELESAVRVGTALARCPGSRGAEYPRVLEQQHFGFPDSTSQRAKRRPAPAPAWGGESDIARLRRQGPAFKTTPGSFER